MTISGSLVQGADCKLTSDYGLFLTKSGATIQMRRSIQVLEMVCRDPANPDALATAISRANGAMFGNIILGSGIRAIIDHYRGTAYSYPRWVQLVFGKTLEFNRKMENEGQSAIVVEPAVTVAGFN